MVSYENMCGGRIPFRISVGTLPVFLVSGGGVNGLSNGGVGKRQYSCEIIGSSPGAAIGVDDGGVVE